MATRGDVEALSCGGAEELDRSGEPPGQRSSAGAMEEICGGGGTEKLEYAGAEELEYAKKLFGSMEASCC
jgi:hypothetical protein